MLASLVQFHELFPVRFGRYIFYFFMRSDSKYSITDRNAVCG